MKLQVQSERSGHRLVQVGTARHYTCSKNIYFVGSWNTLPMAMELLLLRLNW